MGIQSSRFLKAKEQDNKDVPASEAKILLLGLGESGKSTLIKQMKLIYGCGYTLEEKFAFKEIIFSNIIQSIQVILKSIKDIYANERYYQLVLQSPPQVIELSPDIVEAIRYLWKDNHVLNAFERRHEYQLNDSAKYFLDAINRISSIGYIPTDQDVLRARIKTSDLTETTFNINNIKYHMIDAVGQKTKNTNEWMQYFENLTAVMFLVAISEYNQVLVTTNGTTKNRLLEAIELFQSICNSKWFINTPIILFLNKIDLFKEKIKNKHHLLANTFTDYNKEYDSFCHASQFILEKFLNVRHHQVYTHFTCTTDTKQIKGIMKSVNDIVIQHILNENNNLF